MLEIIIFALCSFIFWFILDQINYSKYPPGPFRFPLIGNILQISKASSLPAVAFRKLGAKYGDIFYLRMGFRETVVFNSYETIKDIRGHELCQDISQTMLPLVAERMNHKNLGLIWCNGKEWQVLRRFTLRTLRDFGFGKAASMDVVVNEEAEKFIRHLESKMKKENVIEDTPLLFSLTIVNILWRLVTGVDYEMTDKEMLRLLKLSNDVVRSSNFALDLSIAYPFLYHWFPKKMGKIEQVENCERLKDFMQETVDRHRKLGDYKISPNCYVDVFLAKMEEEEGNPDSVFTPEQLLLCLLDLFQAGSDTTSNTLAFSILYMIIHQNVQKKIQKEIDENIEKDEIITMESKSKLPYTYATVLECARFSTVLPVPVAQEATQDFHYKGYLIKKKMILTSNVYGAHFDERLWGDPFNFRPERFLNKEGTAVDSKIASNLIQFGYGPRFCIGASLAENANFVYVAAILRKFKVEQANPSEVLSVEPQLGMTYSPKPFKAKYIPRACI